MFGGRRCKRTLAEIKSGGQMCNSFLKRTKCIFSYCPGILTTGFMYNRQLVLKFFFLPRLISAFKDINLSSRKVKDMYLKFHAYQPISKTSKELNCDKSKPRHHFPNFKNLKAEVKFTFFSLTTLSIGSKIGQVNVSQGQEACEKIIFEVCHIRH